MELVDFLHQRLAEDERIARDADAVGRWGWDLGEEGSAQIYDDATTQVIGSTVNEVVAHHLTSHDPARVLREVEAKRRIIAVVVPRIIEMDEQIIGEWGRPSDIPDEHLPLLKLLALPYAEHPSYDEAWRP